MLRVEKSKNCQINVCFRKRESCFNPLFLKALGLALAIHLSGFIFFRIHPFKSDSNFIFPPIQVVSQPKLESSLVAIEHPSTENLSFPIAMFTPAPFMMPNPPDFSAPALETSSLENVPSISIPIEKTYYPIQIHVSGHLANRKLVEGTPDLSPRRTFQSESQQYHLTYRVQVDPETGVVFWIDKLLSSNLKAVDKQVERILHQLRFETNANLDGTQGQIDFFVTQYD